MSSMVSLKFFSSTLYHPYTLCLVIRRVLSLAISLSFAFLLWSTSYMPFVRPLCLLRNINSVSLTQWSQRLTEVSLPFSLATPAWCTSVLSFIINLDNSTWPAMITLIFFYSMYRIEISKNNSLCRANKQQKRKICFL